MNSPDCSEKPTAQRGLAAKSGTMIKAEQNFVLRKLETKQLKYAYYTNWKIYCRNTKG